MSEDTGWLIEHPHDPRYGRVTWYSGKDGFTIDSLEAVRFARKEDAEREIDRFPVTLAKHLTATHHAWVPSPPASAPQVEPVAPEIDTTRTVDYCDQLDARYRTPVGENKVPAAIAEACRALRRENYPTFALTLDAWWSFYAREVEKLKLTQLRLTERWNNEQIDLVMQLNRERELRERAVDAANAEAGRLQARLRHLSDRWVSIGESLRQFGHSPAHEDQWPSLVDNALAELDRRTIQRTSDPNLLAEIVATHDDTSEDSEWIILHARLEKFLKATGTRGLKNLLGTVTMLRERLLDIGDELLSKQVPEGPDECLRPCVPCGHDGRGQEWPCDLPSMHQGPCHQPRP